MANPRSSMREETQQETTIPAQSRCPRCSDINGEFRPRIKDPKGVHKCQVCRSEMTAKYADALPGIKAAKQAEMEKRR